MLTYNVARLVVAFPPSRRDPGVERNRQAVNDGEFSYHSADSLCLSPESKLRQLIDAPQNVDQSADVMACAGLMARTGLDEAAMLGVLLNPDNAISQHCLAQSDPERAARRAIAKTRKDVRQPPPGSGPVSISAKPFVYRDPATIPVRPWLYGRQILRGSVTAVVAPGGVGKTTLLIGTALALVTGRSILGQSVRDGPHRVWLWNLEDSGEELTRTVTGAMMHWGINEADIGERLFINSGLDGEQLCLATQTRDDGPRIVAPVVEALKAEIRARKIDVLVVDPFVSSHMVSENDNMAIDMVAKQWANIAAETNCAVLLVHHTRKTNGQEADAESARGASSLTNAARSVLVLNRMTTGEAKVFHIPDDERRFYFRVTADKQNRAPPSKANWYKLAGVFLDNGPEGGDSVGTVVPWTPPDNVESVSPDQLREVQRRIDEGAFRLDQKAVPWAGDVIADVFNINTSSQAGRRRVKSILDGCIARGDLVVEERFSESRKRNVEVVMSGVRM
jgi:KaiC/GvpD/RAD55 family RecA-like ATPase